MKRKSIYMLTILLTILIMLTGCGKQDTSKPEKSEKEEEKVQEQVQEQEKSQPKINWSEIYLQAIKDGTIKPYNNMKIQFIDTDFDNIPEMYYSYVDASSEKYLSSSGNADGLSTFAASAKIYGSSDKNANVSTYQSGEITKEDNQAYEFAFVHLLPTDEYVWARSTFGGEFYIKSLKTEESYSALTQRGTKIGSSEVVFEYAGIYIPKPVVVDATKLDEQFEKAFEKAVSYYVPNDELLKAVTEEVDISDWASIYKEFITEKDILTPYNNAQIAFVDIDDNKLPDMIYGYKNDEGLVCVDVFKLTKAGNVVPVGIGNEPPNYGSGYKYDLEVRFGYINVLERKGWVLTSPDGQVLLTDDFTVDGIVPFYINSTYGPDKGMAQYNKYTICELIPESKMPEGVGDFVSINTVNFDGEFDKDFEEAVGKYVANDVILDGESEDVED